MEKPSDLASLGMSVEVTLQGVKVSSGGGEPRAASFLEAAAHFTGSMTKFAASGFKTVKDGDHQLRLSKCEPCEYRQETRCTLCRCFIDKKAWLPHEDCPIGRWPV